MVLMENGTMDSNSEVVDSHIIMDLLITDDPLVTLKKSDDLTRENNFSNCNGDSTKDDELSSRTNGVNVCNNCEDNSYSNSPKGSNSSQCSISSIQKPIPNSLEDNLSNLSINAHLDEISSKLTESNCKSNSNNEYTSDLNEESQSIYEGEPKRNICSADTGPVQDNVQSSHNSEKEKEDDDGSEVVYICYESEKQMPDIMKLIQKDLSEPYSIYTYRYFIHNWPHLCFLAVCKGKSVGAIVCKLDVHRKVIKRGYIAMLAVDECYRKHGIGSNLVLKAIRVMAAEGADEVVLETEITNQPALRLYENLGFVRDKRLFRYYLNGVDALRLKLWLR